MLRTIRLDPSDTVVFERAAEPGEPAVVGGFVFWDVDPERLSGKARQEFRAGFLGVESFGFSTLATVGSATALERETALAALAAAIRDRFAAPGLEAARAAAEEELAYAEGLCEGHEPGTVSEFGFNRKAYETLPSDLRRILDLAAAATQVHGLLDFHGKNAIAIDRIRTELKGKVELVQFPAPVLRELRKLAGAVIREQSEKSPMAKKVHASFTKFQALVGPWDHVAEGAYHQLVAG